MTRPFRIFCLSLAFVGIVTAQRGGTAPAQQGGVPKNAPVQQGGAAKSGPATKGGAANIAPPKSGSAARIAPGSETSPPIARTPAEKRVLDTITAAVRAGSLFGNVPAADGRMLRILAEAANAKNVVEVGTSTGISALWLCLALEKTGGRLTTFELDKVRAAHARKHFQQAGVEGRVTLVEGDAHVNITNLRDPIDLVFLDAEKPGYVDYFNKLLPLVRPGGIVLAHNTNMIPEYMRIVTSSPDLDTVVYTTGKGMAVTLKKR